MKFEFIFTKEPNFAEWDRIIRKLENDLLELSSGQISCECISEYLSNMLPALQTVNGAQNGDMLFLMFDQPHSMPPDARVDYVYTPTYIAATIAMTAMNRFASIRNNESFRSSLYALLNACTGRNFLGAGYDSCIGLLNTLHIFAKGDTQKFVDAYPEFNPRFTNSFSKAVSFLETEICTGTLKDVWSGQTYAEYGKKVLAMLRNSRHTDSEYVWYACYGSNLSYQRFMNYINQCNDTTPPKEDRPFLFPYSIYFAKASATWKGGKAFLDDTAAGNAYGRVYLITRDQYEEIKFLEGPDYTKALELGIIDGYPVYSFTDTQKNTPETLPSYKYFGVILDGLLQCYGDICGKADLVQYLIDAIFPKDVFSAAKAIKESPHYVSGRALMEKTNLSSHEILYAVKWLLDHSVIRQDTRSIRAGHEPTELDAFFYTVDSPCARKLLESILLALSSSPSEESLSGDAEGGRHFVYASRIERSARNRIEAIKLHGYKCMACGFDFTEAYGDLGRNYIEVHHTTPLAFQNGECIVNPLTDLVCLCSNCHRMVHRKGNTVLPVDELRRLLRK